MKKLSLFLLLLIQYSCTTEPVADTSENTVLLKDSLINVLRNTDIAWSETAAKKGYHQSRLDFAANDAIDMLEGSMPLMGIDAIRKFVETHPDSDFVMSWHPVTADVAASGDLGYTFGSWKMVMKLKEGKDTTMFGDYLTVWKKQEDGSWKYVVDGGNGTPAEIR